MRGCGAVRVATAFTLSDEADSMLRVVGSVVAVAESVFVESLRACAVFAAGLRAGCIHKWLAMMHIVVSTDSMMSNSRRIRVLSVLGRKCLGFEAFHPIPKDFYALVSEFFKTSCSVLHRTYSIGMAFRVKLVGVANELFFESFRRIVS